jgi:zinc transport system ATP-binding protein
LIKLFGEEIKKFKDWRKIGYVPQKVTNFDVNFPATVFEIVAMGGTTKIELFSRAAAEEKQAIQDALQQVNMWEYRDRLIGDLSGGQQQRIFIARALVNHPAVIFLDEPTTGVDKITQDGFYGMLQDLNRRLGITLILVSHDIGRLTKEAMHIACVDRRLTCHMSPQEYLKASQSDEIMSQPVKIISHHHHH